MQKTMPIPGRVLEGPAAWRGEELRAETSWIRQLSAAECERLEDDLAEVKARGSSILDIGAEDFPVPTLGPTLAEVRRELLHGRGFVVLRGLDMHQRTLADAATLFWGLGQHLGRPVMQNSRGHVLGHVKDLGYDSADPNARIYQTRERQYYHTDSADIVALMCIRPAKAGGLSSLISSVTAHNEMLRRHPELYPVLFEPIHTDHRGEFPPGADPYFSIPVFNYYRGRLITIYQRRYIESAQRFSDVPALTERQVRALDAFDAILEDPRLHLRMALQPGDIQLVHNHQILHDRTAFVDWPEPDRRRHLLRLWLCPPDGWPLPPCFAERYGSVEIGRRGGIQHPELQSVAPLQA